MVASCCVSGFVVALVLFSFSFPFAALCHLCIVRCYSQSITPIHLSIIPIHPHTITPPTHTSHQPTNKPIKEEVQIVITVLPVQLHFLLLRFLQRSLLRLHQVVQRHDRPHERTQIQQLPLTTPLHSHHVYVVRLDGHRLLDGFQLRYSILTELTCRVGRTLMMLCSSFMTS